MTPASDSLQQWTLELLWQLYALEDQSSLRGIILRRRSGSTGPSSGAGATAGSGRDGGSRNSEVYAYVGVYAAAVLVLGAVGVAVALLLR